MPAYRAAFALCLSTILLAACQEDGKPAVSLSQAVKTTAKFEGQSFTPPPRKIEDVRKMLAAASNKSFEAMARLRAVAAGAAGAGTTAEERARSLYKRAIAAGELGKNRQMRDDLAAALKEDPPAGILKVNILIASGAGQHSSGNLRGGIKFLERAMALLDRLGTHKVRLSAIHATLGKRKVEVGDLDGAARELDRSRQVLARLERRGRASSGILSIPYAKLLRAEATIAVQSGKFEQAEAKARSAMALMEKAIADKVKPANDLPVYPFETVLKMDRVTDLKTLAVVLTHQERYAEGEIAARDAIRISAATFGRDSIYVARALDPMVLILSKTGRLVEARTLAKVAIDILDKLGVDKNGHSLNKAHHRLGAVFVANSDWRQALVEFEKIAKAAAGDDLLLDRFYRYNLDRATALLQTNKAGEAARITGPAARRLIDKLGAKHFETAQALGLDAVARQRQGQAAQALTSFRQAFKILSTRSRQSSGGENAGRGVRLRLINEGYLAALMASGGDAEAREAFRIASFASARSVQTALVQSAARASISDPALRDLVRKEQDAQKQIAALYGILSNALIGDNVAKSETIHLRGMISDLRAARAALMEAIEGRFPEYAELINPKPAKIASIQPLLSADEAMLVTYVGTEQTHVWALPAKGPVAFTSFDQGRRSLQAAVDDLREALAPEIETLGDIPAFDIAKAHALYANLMQPVSAAWQGAENLFVVAHGPLVHLPFALLPTKASKIGAQREPLFIRYSDVPWLIRDHAVAMLPSAHALAALRNLPLQSGQRRQFAGFGDPLFGGDDDERIGTPASSTKNKQVAAVKTRGIKTRGAKRRSAKNRGIKLRSTPKVEGLASAGLDILPRLPETADEIRGIAATMQADLSRDIFIGRAATEDAVKNTDLSAYRVLAFATHGLIPGDLDGLSQPALALTSPKAVPGKDDGLLTMGEILGLKLNADWVVLSACNTGSGEGAGAEAVSGLGRAFFYAGTRALLVSNWPVETTSAMALTTDLFRRQYKDPALARAQALRQAILALIDGPGYVDADTDQTVFSYAHPIFWAPFSLVGDGGASRSGA